MTEFDTSELEDFRAQLGKVALSTLADVQVLAEQSAKRVEKEWRARWRGMPHAPSLAAAVTHDMQFGLGWVGYEVGPDKSKRQGALGNIIELGTINNPPHPAGGPAINAEIPQLVKALEDRLVTKLEE